MPTTRRGTGLVWYPSQVGLSPDCPVLKCCLCTESVVNDNTPSYPQPWSNPKTQLLFGVALAGKEFQVELASDANFGDLKQALSVAAGLPPADQVSTGMACSALKISETKAGQCRVLQLANTECWHLCTLLFTFQVVPSSPSFRNSLIHWQFCFIVLRVHSRLSTPILKV